MSDQYQTTFESASNASGNLYGGTTADRERALFDRINNTAADYPRERCIHELVEAQATAKPDAVAVVFEEQRLTYGELDERARCVARRLRVSGITVGSMVGVCLQRSAETVVALFGVLKAGAAYVPLDPDYPRERLAFIIEDAGIELVLTEAGTTAAVPDEIRTLRMDALPDDSLAAGMSAASTEPHHIAYVVYTSGSTGWPKGVAVTHRNVVNLLSAVIREPGLGPEDVFLAVTTLSFDIAALEIFGPLVVGAQLVVATREEQQDGRRLVRRIQVCGATVIQATPATWHVLLAAGWGESSSLRVWCGGEAMTPALAVELLTRASIVWNLYGPSETTIWSTVHEVSVLDIATGGAASIPIGRPLANTRVYVFDDQQRQLGAGTPGELYIAGDGVASGYLNRSALTGESFLPDPFADDELQRMYKTGDRVRLRSDGCLEFLGRMDDQVKLRGHRIELGEIEARLGAHPDIAAVAVVLHGDGGKAAKLVAFVVPRKDHVPAPLELRKYLAVTLPRHMLPADFVTLPALPLTPNRKIDRGALRAWVVERGSEQAATTAGDRISDCEKALIRLWQRVLERDHVGLHDNFFELEGDSLRAVSLLIEIQESFGIDLPLAELFQNPTVAELAARLGDNTAWGAGSKLVPIQSAGYRTPLVCIGGPFSRLAPYLHAEQPLYMLPIKDLMTAGLSTTIGELAGRAVEEIRKLQPYGPYRLAGYCFGGNLVFEIAAQLHRGGEHTESLLLIESEANTAERSASRRLAAYRLFAGAQTHLNALRVQGARHALHYVWQRARRRILTRLWQSREAVGSDTSGALEYLTPDVAAIRSLAIRNYVPSTYPGKVTLITGRAPAWRWRVEDPYLGWQNFLDGGVDVHCTSGDHLSLFREPNVAALAQIVDHCLEDVEGVGADLSDTSDY